MLRSAVAGGQTVPLDGFGPHANTQVFTGHQMDGLAGEGTGLIYMNARYYDPGVGAFLTADTYLGDVGDPMSLDRYVYVASNPGRFVDPSGHFNGEFQLSPPGSIRNGFSWVRAGISESWVGSSARWLGREWHYTYDREAEFNADNADRIEDLRLSLIHI